jgi:hypothetical protein
LPGFGTQNRSDLLGVYGESKSIALAAIENSRHFTGHAQAARFVFASLIARRPFYNDVSHTFFPSDYPLTVECFTTCGGIYPGVETGRRKSK